MKKNNERKMNVCETKRVAEYITFIICELFMVGYTILLATYELNQVHK